MYERFGFEVVGERRNYYKEPVEDAKIMTRRLAPTA
jgi:ribosomal protein S18 acetylase RimI-like enzyme